LLWQLIQLDVDLIRLARLYGLICYDLKVVFAAAHPVKFKEAIELVSKISTSHRKSIGCSISRNTTP
jgi:hypothetical protein